MRGCSIDEMELYVVQGGLYVSEAVRNVRADLNMKIDFVRGLI